MDESAPHDEGICEIVVTGPDLDELAAITKKLLEAGLIACAHQSTIRATYIWRGEVVDEAEARARLHTRTELIEEVTRVVEAEHPYEVPCVMALPVIGGSVEYEDWVKETTADAA
ncbi:divalent-cation tolerance protein CutA [Salininema proteolyticum]|uniref:Divalent-cation tolerance protein CutA n=1 Tax=Salininema proteolyticum TaxID=1607685 RepID=A0ABV8U5G8_9ACTN